MRKLDLGCGRNCLPGYIGIDKHPYPGVDIVRDIDRHGLPFDSDSADEVVTFHFLEHCHDLVFVMNEIWRVLKQGGRCVIRVPSVEKGTGAFRDPTHVRYFNSDSFRYFVKGENSSWYESLRVSTFRLVKMENTGEEITVILEK